MSQKPDFKTSLIESTTINDLTDEEIFGVLSGPALSTYTQFQAISASGSQIVWNVQIPSESILIDRHLLMTSLVNFTISLGGPGHAVPVNENCINWGLTEALSAFPLQSLFTTVQATINNTSTSVNLQDILPMILRMNDNRKLARYNSMTPSLPDCQWGAFNQAVNIVGPIANSNNNILSSLNNNGYDNDFQPRGSFPVTLLDIVHNITGAGTDQSLISTNVNDTWSIGLQFRVTEPFLALSPFTNCMPQSNQSGSGLIGINNMSIVCNVDSTCKRLLGTANTSVNGGVISSYISNISLGATGYQPFSETRLLFNFQTLTSLQYSKISSKCIVPYTDYPRYLTTFTSNTPLVPNNSQTLTSQNIQLNQIPGLIMISVRVPMSEQNWNNTSSFLTINNITINFNSQSGLLASATPQDLYNISYRNGCAQTYYEWSGYNNNFVNGPPNSNAVQTGSLLVLNPALDFSLPEFLSCGSLGQFSFQFNINVTNNYEFNVTPEICIITKNDGLFVTQQGTSVIYTGILDKATVLRTKEQDASLDYNTHQRLVGGRLSSSGMGAIKKMLRYHSQKQMDHMAGGASSGGASSGGASSGGRRHRLSKHLM
ncbi:hypothetical protein OAA60_05585 [Porticoccaceae bacterium]|nr:hypothetical protein [Porticoccaceae bacterium]